MAIDDITGLPLLSSDIYQIPLNTDAIPYNDLQAEARLPRQPMLPDDIIPTIALTTGLRSDGTGEVVHTDDHHAQWVYVVNQLASSGGGSSALAPNKFSGPSDQIAFGGTTGDYMADASTLGTSRLCVIHAAFVLDRDNTGSDTTPSYAFAQSFLHQHRPVDVNFYLGAVPLYYSTAHPAGSMVVGTLHLEYPTGLLLTDLGFDAGHIIELWYSITTNYNIRASGYAAWHDA